jgi:hypothetical protein
MAQEHLPEPDLKSAQRSVSPASGQEIILSFGQSHPILQLQRALGNRRVAELIQAKRLTPRGRILPLQPKLTVGAVDDPYEKQADAVARQIVGIPDSEVQPAPAIEPGDVHDLQSKTLPAIMTPFAQRSSDDREDPQGHRSTGPDLGGFEAGTAVEAHINQSKGQGSPLPDHVRGFMEPRFGAEFSHVRVHTGSEAIQMNQAIGAQAFTHGSDIYFGAGHDPGQTDLTAHELTHVLQQQRGPVLPDVARKPKQTATPPVSCSFNCTDPAFTTLDAPGREAQFNTQCPQGYPKGTTFFGQPIPSESSPKLKGKLVDAEAKAKRAMCLNGQDPGAYTLDRRIITYAAHSPAQDRAVDIDVMGQPYIMHEHTASSTVANLPKDKSKDPSNDPSKPPPKPLPAGLRSYVTDGKTTSDCTVGGGSQQVLCGYDGTAWAHVQGVGNRDEAVGPVYDRIKFWANYQKSIIPNAIKSVELGQGGGTSRTWNNPDTGAKKEGITTGELYDKLKTESDAMKEYFALLLKSDTDLDNALDTFLANNKAPVADLVKLGLPTGHSADDVKHLRQTIAEDYRILGGSKAQLQSFAGQPIAGASHTPKPVFGNLPFAGGAVAGTTEKNGAPDPAANRRPELGFIVLPKEVVVALTEVGLAWGAIDFGAESGDVMHFDCRNTSC